MIDYLNFDYENEKEINKALDIIHKEIEYCVNDYIDNVDERGLMSLYSMSHEKRKNVAPDYTHQNIIIYEPELCKKIKDLGMCEKALAIARHFRCHREGKENFIIKRSRDKMTLDLTKINKRHIEDIRSYALFVLAIHADSTKKLENKDFMSEEEYNKTLQLRNRCSAYFHNLIRMQEKLEDANEKLYTYRRMHDYRRPNITKFMIECDIAGAHSLLNEVKLNKANQKKLRYLMYDSFQNLNLDKNKLDEIIEITESIVYNNVTNEKRLNHEKTKEHFKKILSQETGELKNGILGSLILTQIDKEKELQTIDSFFGYSDSTPEEKLVILQSLRLSTISTQEQLKDYLVDNRNEILVEKTPDELIEISITNSGAVRTNEKCDADGLESESAFGKVEKTISYIYDPYRRELVGYKLANSAKMMELDFDKEINDSLKNEFKLFLFNLETNINARLVEILGIKVPYLKGFKGNVDLAKVKDKVKKETKGNIQIESTSEFTAGTASINSFRVKAYAGTMKFSTTLKNEKGELALPSIKSTLKTENGNISLSNISNLLSSKISLGLLTLSFKEERLEGISYGTTYNSIFGVVFKQDNNGYVTVPETLAQYYGENIKNVTTMVNGLIACAKNDTTKLTEMVDSGLLDKSKYSNISSLKMTVNLVKDLVYNLGVSKATIDDTREYIEQYKNSKEESAIKKHNKLNDGRKDSRSITNKMVDTFGKLKNEQLFKIDKFTYMDESKYETKLKELLGMPVVNENIEYIHNYLNKVKNPENYYSYIRQLQGEPSQIENVQNLYKKRMATRVMNLAKNDDIDTLFKLLVSGKFDEEISKGISLMKDKMQIARVLKSLSDKTNENIKQNETLDELINRNYKNYERLIPEQTITHNNVEMDNTIL